MTDTARQSTMARDNEEQLRRKIAEREERIKEKERQERELMEKIQRELERQQRR